MSVKMMCVFPNPDRLPYQSGCNFSVLCINLKVRYQPESLNTWKSSHRVRSYWKKVKLAQITSPQTKSSCHKSAEMCEAVAPQWLVHLYKLLTGLWNLLYLDTVRTIGCKCIVNGCFSAYFSLFNFLWLNCIKLLHLKKKQNTVMIELCWFHLKFLTDLYYWFCLV